LALINNASELRQGGLFRLAVKVAAGALTWEGETQAWMFSVPPSSQYCSIELANEKQCDSESGDPGEPGENLGLHEIGWSDRYHTRNAVDPARWRILKTHSKSTDFAESVESRVVAPMLQVPGQPTLTQRRIGLRNGRL